MNSFDAFILAPLSAGDIIDRAVRLYRQHFVTLLRIVLAPSLIAYAGGIAYTVGAQNISQTQGDLHFLINTTLLVGGITAYLAGKVAFFALIGGTSRSLVNYFLDSSPLRARDVYRVVRERLWPLVGATVTVLVLMISVLSLVTIVAVLILAAYASSSAWLLRGMPYWVQVIFHLVFVSLIAGIFLALFLLIYLRLVYVPQALMVEEKGVFSAISRSFTLAGRDVRRIGAIFLFDIYVTWSVLLLLIIPLGWYAYLNGVDITPLGPEKPLWYSISYQTLAQLSEILLAPIAMLGFTLLYIDSRVRKEGFDIELLANRQLPATGLMPPPRVIQPTPIARSSFPSILGLNDYGPAPPRPPAETREHVTARESATESDTETRICQNCGTSAGPEDRFCRNCGALYEQVLEVRG